MSSRQLDASTEEILASIRDMMAAEGGEQTRGRVPPHGAGSVRSEDDILNLTDIVDVPGKEVAQLMEDQLARDDREAPFAPPKPAPRAAAPAPRRQAASAGAPTAAPRAPRAAAHAAADARRREERMISEKTATQAAASLAHLIQAKVQHRASQAISVEELMMEAVRPLLGVWLDEHLPEIVERVVEVEIKKLLSR